MKKILAGYFYRLIRGFEIWVLLAVLLLSTAYMNFSGFNRERFISINLTGEEITEEIRGKDENTYVNIGPDEIDQYRFAGLGVSAYDVYRMEGEVLPKAERDILCRRDKVCFASEEANFIINSVKDSCIMPIILIVLFITLFFGRLFSDGVIKNLIASGLNKRTIYLSSLLFTSILNLVMLAVSIGVVALFCLIYKWHPPVYLPMLLFIVLIDFLMALTVSSLVLAVLFASRKKTAAVITGFVVVFSMFFIPFTPAILILEANADGYYEEENERYKEVRDELSVYGMHILEAKFDLLAYSERLYYKDGMEYFPFKVNLPVPVQRGLAIWIYSDHALLRRTGWRDYPLYRDGVYAINASCNVFWSVLFNAAGFMIFKKRELI